MTTTEKNTGEIVQSAFNQNIPVPAFNIPYLPMMEPVTKAIVDSKCFALIEVARLEWEKFESKSSKAVKDEYDLWCDPAYMRLHLDHIPVIDEDGLEVDYLKIIREAIDLGYESVMLDGSRLDLDENISATRKVVELAHAAGVACEAELGAVLGHESGPLPPYEILFKTRRGFTDVDEARRFVEETGVDWLSVAIGNIHGNISKSLKDKKKIEAKLHIGHLQELAAATCIPLVLHGGSGVRQEYIHQAIKNGMTKINIGTDIRQPYEIALKETGDIDKAKEAAYNQTCWIIRDNLIIEGSQLRL